MSQNYTYPPGFATATNASIGLNGVTAPTSSTEVGGINNSGNLTPLSLDSSGNLNVNVTTSVIPTGGATAANQVTEINTLNALNAKLAASLVPTAFDYITLTYVPSGAGVSQIQTAVYKTGGSGGTTVATLTLVYDGSDRLASVTKT